MPTSYYTCIFYGKDADAFGMVSPYHNYIFFPTILDDKGYTEVEICAGDADTKIPIDISRTVINKTKMADVCEDIFDILKALPENHGLNYRRMF